MSTFAFLYPRLIWTSGFGRGGARNQVGVGYGAFPIDYLENETVGGLAVVMVGITLLWFVDSERRE
jgi:hypothetical protein